MASAAPAAPLDVPDADAVVGFAQAVSLAGYRGILNTLDDIERSQPAHSAFVGTMRQLAGENSSSMPWARILEQAPRDDHCQRFSFTATARQMRWTAATAMWC